MKTIGIVLIMQIITLVCWHISMYPGSYLANYMKKVFKDYGKALYITNSIQIIGIVIIITYLILTV